MEKKIAHQRRWRKKKLRHFFLPRDRGTVLQLSTIKSNQKEKEKYNVGQHKINNAQCTQMHNAFVIIYPTFREAMLASLLLASAQIYATRNKYLPLEFPLIPIDDWRGEKHHRDGDFLVGGVEYNWKTDEGGMRRHMLSGSKCESLESRENLVRSC